MRKDTAALLLTNHVRMQISRRKYSRAKKGVTKYQALFRGVTKRRVLAALKLQTYTRMHKRRTNYLKLKSAILALQCRTRVKIAKTFLKSLQGEQKDIGKLKQNNEKLKMEMQSLKAMLTAQAKEGASNAKHAQELEDKQKEIDRLEKRVAELESQLATEKAAIVKLEEDMKVQKEQTAELAQRASIRAPGSPRRSTTKSSHHEARVSDTELNSLAMPGLPSNYVSPEIVAKHKASVSRLEGELKEERKLRREADGEIIKLRAAINGVELNDAEVDALLAQKMEGAPKKAERYVSQMMYSLRDNAQSIVGVRFVALVTFAFVLNGVVSLFLMHRRSSGLATLRLLTMFWNSIL